MSTAREIIGKALRSTSVVASGDSATMAEYTDCLYALNSIIDGLYADPSYYYTEHDEQFVLSSKAAYCIGSESVPLESLTCAGTTATAKTAIPHGLVSGNKISVSGATESVYNATATITVTGQYTFTYQIASGATPATGSPVITSGDFNTSRPVRCVGAYVESAGSTTPVSIVTEAYWTNVVDKAASGDTPQQLLYRPNFPFGQVLISPTPTGSAILHLRLEKTIGRFKTLDQQRQLPPGYQRMLEIMLAVDVAPEFGARVSEPVVAMLRETLSSMNEQNRRGIINSIGGVSGNGNSA